ncbi:hypothetical protein [Neobacillus vireti]|uniref:Uncharacterized protein n=1 Tax=Neobacillus vireti LMG 21834 TaxID=1131730 RepID=A0AB94IMG5_9BACI|nr:hypothetical protein [Neobacillus vireti]ETI68133.1 hypothetical protein BAVI_14059 [Neobacillus vireti LMG 21834]KLT15908.1 hypothetical protein AA980_22200 [Neobacillus vireti]
MTTFKIQVPTEIVKNKEYSDKEFVLLAKLIQIYYRIPETQKSLTFGILHKDVMFYSGIKDNDTFKETLKGLYDKGAIKNKVETLPRKGGIEIILNEEVIPQMNKEGFFTQLSSEVLNKNIIDAVGHSGIRLLYFYKSYINSKTNKNHCYVAEETTAEILGMTKKTVIKYNKLLQKHKLLKIEKHESEHAYYTTKKGTESYLFTKYNNHYFIRYENIENFSEKSA